MGVTLEIGMFVPRKNVFWPVKSPASGVTGMLQRWGSQHLLPPLNDICFLAKVICDNRDFAGNKVNPTTARSIAPENNRTQPNKNKNSKTRENSVTKE